MKNSKQIYIVVQVAKYIWHFTILSIAFSLLLLACVMLINLSMNEHLAYSSREVVMTWLKCISISGFGLLLCRSLLWLIRKCRSNTAP